MLHVHRAERADRLVDALAGVLATPLDDPLASEVVAVPTRGVERWLAQRLATVLGVRSRDEQDGICANVAFPFPGRLLLGAVAEASGVDRDADPWLPERAAWPLLEVVEERRDDGRLALLAAHLQAGADRRFAAVRRLSDLFDRYAVHRPAMLRAWARGRDVDGDDRRLPADVRWQAHLWRALRERIGTPSPAERLATACERLKDEPDLVDVPPRFALFGLTRLPASALDVLDALAVHRDAHLLLLHPSPTLWQRVRSVVRDGGPLPRRADDPSRGAPANPLVASWGRDVREVQVVLAARGGAAGRVEHHHAAEEAPATLLQRLQAAVRTDAAPPGAPLPGEPERRPLLAAGDRSVEVHACHGRARQVEVVRDVVLHLLQDDDALEPRDVVVMCPDIDAFAPLLAATFGAADEEDDAAATGSPWPDVRVRLADRSLRQTNPVLGVVAELLALASARVTASQVVDLASREPVRRRFGFDDDDLARLAGWLPAAGVRWGLDAEHRAAFQLEAVPAGTWRAGIDRLLLGVARSEDDLALFADVLPLDDVDSGDIDLAGRVAELVDRLGDALGALRGPQPLRAWAAALAAAADALTAVDRGTAWQRDELQRVLDDVVDEAGAVGRVDGGAALAIAEVEALLANRLRGQPTRASFRTGALTACTLVPMRSVPHRVIVLLGLDDGTFPRRTTPEGDDLLVRDPVVGDRDARSEDRQLLLDALLAARDRLVVTYAGRDERTNAERPPAVPVGELLDVVDATVRTEDPDPAGGVLPARSRVVVEHPLQPFSPRCFTDGELVPARRWSFDRVGLAGARAVLGERTPPSRLVGDRLPPAATDLLELDDLVRFVQHPVRAFLRQRLGVSLAQRDDELDDALPVELDGLARWSLGERLLDARLRGLDKGEIRAAELARGGLPPLALGGPVLVDVGRAVDVLVEAAERALAGDAAGAGAHRTSAEVDVELPDGRRVLGVVPDVVGDVVRPVSFSRLGPKHRAAAWVRLLALGAARPERALSAVSVGRGWGEGTAAVARLAPLGATVQERRATAMAHLVRLVDLHARGLREPLPLACASSAAWADAVARGRDPQDAARREWETRWADDGRRFAGEQEDLEHELVHGGVVPFDALLAYPPAADEHGDGWSADEPTRFGRCARRLWDGLLVHERVRWR